MVQGRVPLSGWHHHICAMDWSGFLCPAGAWFLRRPLTQGLLRDALGYMPSPPRGLTPIARWRREFVAITSQGFSARRGRRIRGFKGARVRGDCGLRCGGEGLSGKRCLRNLVAAEALVSRWRFRLGSDDCVVNHPSPSPFACPAGSRNGMGHPARQCPNSTPISASLGQSAHDLQDRDDLFLI